MQFSDDPLHIYAVTIAVVVLCALVGDYLERSETGTCMLQQWRRFVVKILKGFPKG